MDLYNTRERIYMICGVQKLAWWQLDDNGQISLSIIIDDSWQCDCLQKVVEGEGGKLYQVTVEQRFHNAETGSLSTNYFPLKETHKEESPNDSVQRSHISSRVVAEWRQLRFSMKWHA